MSQEIIVQGSAQEIARKIAEFPGKIVKAILVVENPNLVLPEEDAWSSQFRRWVASHGEIEAVVDDSRESIYRERLQ